MVKNKTLPSIRIDERTFTHIQEAIKKYNQTSLTKLDEASFRRSSYEIFAQLILQDKLKDLPIKISELE